jgi:TolA-binding protein
MSAYGNPEGHLPDSCERLQQNIERRRVDDPRTNEWLDADDKTHLSMCPECAGFIELLHAMPMQRFVVDERVQHEVIDRVNALYFTRHKRSRRLLKAVGVVAVLAAVLLTVMRFSAKVTDRARPAVIESSAALALTSGSVVALWHGAAGLYLADGGRATIVEESPSALTIRVERGLLAVSVDPLRKNVDVVRIMAGDVQVSVKGTVFAVERNGGLTRVDVLRGSVECQRLDKKAEPILLVAGRSWNTATQARIQLDQERIRQIMYFLEPSTLSPRPPEAPLDQRQVSENRPTKPFLLTEARKCLIHKKWKCAEARYNQLQRYYPRSAEAVTSLISLAQLKLNRLGMPEQALAHFRAYLKAMPSGPLAEEAAYGISLAYRKLGRRNSERKALQTFVKRYPKSLLYGEASTRLEKLSQ